jgi:serine/threonine protein kinase
VRGQVIAGMVYLHGTRRLIHRDIKPSNVLLNSGGMFKIADFGMSKELSDTMSAGQTWVGTSSYMSPERVMGINYSFNADIWSLGIIVYECCTGQAPFGGAQTYELLDNIVDKEPPALPEDFSNEARHFVSLCLTKDQESRPGSDQLLQHPFILVNQAAPVVQWLTSL